MLSDWVSFLAYPNLFEIKGFVVVVIVFCNIALSSNSETVNTVNGIV
jgi:hypothetical protein